MKEKKIIIFCIGILTLLMEYFLLFWLLFDRPALADSFYPNGEINNCEYVPAVGLAVQQVPEQTSIQYDTSELSGVMYDWIGQHSIHDVANVYKGQVKRYSDIAASVSVPPLSDVAVGYWWLNFSQHPIHVSNASLFMSDPSGSQGFDISRVVTNPTTNVTESYWQRGVIQARSGKAIMLGDMGSFDSTSISSSPRGKVIATLHVNLPLQVIKKSAECSINAEGTIVMQKLISVTNTSTYDLSNVSIVSSADTKLVTAGETTAFIQEENLGKQFSTTVVGKSIQIHDPNSHTECVTRGASSGDILDAATRIILLHRDDNNHPAWWAVQPDFAASPVSNFFCITQLEYTVLVGGFSCNLPIKLTPEIYFGKERIHPGDEQTFFVSVVNNGVGQENVHINVTFDAKDGSIFSGFTKADSATINNGHVVLEYVIPKIDSKETVTFSDTFHVATPLTFDQLGKKEFSITTGTGDAKAAFVVVGDTPKLVTITMEAMTSTETKGTIHIYPADEVKVNAILLQDTWTINNLEACTSKEIPSLEKKIRIQKTITGTLTFVNQQNEQTIISDELNLLYDEFIAGSITINGDLHIPIEIPFVIYYPTSENIGISFSSIACVPEQRETCKTGTIIQQFNNSTSCSNDYEKKIEDIIGGIVPSVAPIPTTSVGNFINTNGNEVISQASAVWNHQITQFSQAKISVQKLAMTGTNLESLLFTCYLILISSSLALFLIRIRVKTSKGTSLPIN